MKNNKYMSDSNNIFNINNHKPSEKMVKKYNEKWEELKDYKAQEEALNKLFSICKDNNDLSNILLKCSVLNDFYSTNIFKIYHIAQHYFNENKKSNIDKRLKEGDKSLVEDLSCVQMNDKVYCFYSFATKYCSHHNQDVYPIYDNYVDKVLRYFRRRDKLINFRNEDLKNYEKYVKIIDSFKKKYKLKGCSYTQIDKYLWLLGRKAFSKH